LNAITCGHTSMSTGFNYKYNAKSFKVIIISTYSGMKPTHCHACNSLDISPWHSFDRCLPNQTNCPEWIKTPLRKICFEKWLTLKSEIDILVGTQCYKGLDWNVTLVGIPKRRDINQPYTLTSVHISMMVQVAGRWVEKRKGSVVMSNPVYNTIQQVVNE
jgi:hypothetical protein